MLPLATYCNALLCVVVCHAPVAEEDRSCSVSVTTSPVHIPGQQRAAVAASPSSSPPAAASRRCGSRDHPWTLEAQTGQQINISLLDFSGHVDTLAAAAAAAGHDGRHCPVQLAYIIDRMSSAPTNNHSICPPANRRKHVYTSRGNKLEIVLTDQASGGEETGRTFLIGFEGSGPHTRYSTFI